MSLGISKDKKTYTLGVFAPRNLMDVEDIEVHLLEKLDSIGKIITNDVDYGGKTVMQFCSLHGINFSVCSIYDKSMLVVNKCIIEQSDFIVIFDDGFSSNTQNVIEECISQKKKYKIYSFSGVKSAAKLKTISEKLNLEIISFENALEKAESCDISKIKKLAAKLAEILNGK